MPADRHAKNRQRLVRKCRRTVAKDATATRPRSAFFGSMDGAPDDQLNPHRPPTMWHTIAVVVGPSHPAMVRFMDDLRANSGRDPFQLGKWNGASHRIRPAYQAAFMRGFTAAMRLHPKIAVMAFACQAQDIRAYWDHYRTSADFPSWAQQRVAADGKEKVLWTDIAVTVRGQPKRFDVEMDAKRAAVLVWIADTLSRIYMNVTRSAGHRPRWDLLCDRLPGDSAGRGIAVMMKLLKKFSGTRLTMHLRAAGPGPDFDEELLADCVVTWAREFKEHPGSAAAHGLQAIFDAPDITTQFHLETYQPLPIKTAPDP